MKNLLESTIKLVEDIKPSSFSDLIEIDKKQVKWTAHNALGNIYLKIAKSFIGETILVPPFSFEDKKNYLNQACEEFRKCERLHPIGVEALTNLGTVLMELEKDEESREYLEKVIKLNPYYEYGYYRLTQLYCKTGKKEEANAIMEQYKKYRPKPKIEKFEKLYTKYYRDIDH